MSKLLMLQKCFLLRHQRERTGKIVCYTHTTGTHTNRQATQLGDGDKEIEIVYGEEKIFCTGQTRAAKAEQKSLVPAREAQQTKPRKDSFHLYSLSPHSPQFQQSAVATPLFTQNSQEDLQSPPPTSRFPRRTAGIGQLETVVSYKTPRIQVSCLSSTCRYSLFQFKKIIARYTSPLVSSFFQK
jgi:hypothetical protein